MEQETRNAIEELWKMKRATNGLDYSESKKRINKITEFIEELEAKLDKKYGKLGEGPVDVSGMSPEDAALMVWRVCNRESREMDQKPAWEVFILTPEDEAKHWGQNGPKGVWRVCWESGPYQWAISLSGGCDMFACEGRNTEPQITGLGSNDLLVEPYYGFDLCFSTNGSRQKADKTEDNEDEFNVLGGWIAGVDTRAIFNEMVLTALNDGAAFNSDDDKRKKRGAKRAAKEAKRHMMKRFREMLREVEPLVAKHVEEKWSSQ